MIRAIIYVEMVLKQRYALYFPLDYEEKLIFTIRVFWEIAGIGQLHDVIETWWINEAVKILDFCYLHI